MSEEKTAPSKKNHSYIEITKKNLEAFPEEILDEDVEVVKVIDLSINKIKSVPEDIERFVNLQELYLTKNKLSSIPDEISKLNKLRKLDLSYNQLTSVGAGLKDLVTLTHLLLSHNKLHSIPEDIYRLTNLQILWLNDNALSYVPARIVRLAKLQGLYLENNRLQEVTNEMYVLSDLTCLSLSGNNDLKLPKKLTRKTEDYLALTQETLTHMRQVVDEKDKWNQIKLMVLGHRSAGKTSLVRVLLDSFKKSRRKRSTTTLSDITSLECEVVPVDMDSTLKGNLYHFAGPIEHGTALQSLLSNSHTIYLITIDLSIPIDEQEYQLIHWILQLQAKIDYNLLSQQFAVIVVGTKCDKLEAKPNLTLSEQLFKSLQKQGKISSFIITSSLNYTGSDELKNEMIRIGKQFSQEVNMMTAPKVYKRVADQISNLAKDGYVFLQLEELKNYIDVMYSNELWAGAAKFLHNSGLVIFQRSTSVVCVNPHLFVKMMAIFEDPNATVIFGDYVSDLPLYEQPVLPHSVLLQKCSLLSKEWKLIQDESLIIDCASSLGCWDKISDQHYFVPSLRSLGKFKLNTPFHHISSAKLVTLACRLSEKNYNFIPPSFWSHLQSFFRNTIDPSSLCHINGFSAVKDFHEMIFLFSKKASHIDIIIQGTKPSTLLTDIDTIVEKVWGRYPTLLFTRSFLCPACVQGLKDDLEELNDTLVDSTSFSDALLKALDFPSSKKACKYGHYLSKLQVTQGYTLPQAIKTQYIWDPVRSEEFFTENADNWKSLPTAPHFRMLTLSESTQGPSTQFEYDHVIEAFARFAGGDKINSTIKIESVLFLQNELLEKKFLDKYTELKYKPAIKFWMNNSNSKAKQRQQWFLQELDKMVIRGMNSSADDKANLVLAWHLCHDDDISNLLSDTEFKFKVPPSPFGKGIPFSMYKGTALNYIQRNTQSKLCPLLLSWVITGNCYPVMESPDQANSLAGKDCKPGYDSHYALVRFPRSRATTLTSSGSMPKNSTPSVLLCDSDVPGGPEQDELVIFNTDQILPRYLVYYSLSQ